MNKLYQNSRIKLNNCKNDLLKNRINVFRNIITLICIVCMYSCSPVSRYNRLVRNYPFLIDKQIFDTIYVRNGERIDTTFIWSEGKDTMYIGGVKIERFRDTFRIYYKEKDCVTNVHTTEIRPSKETQIVKEGKGLTLTQRIAIIFLLALCTLSMIFNLWKLSK